MTVYRFAHALSTLIARLYFRFRVIHRDRIIEEGPAILAMNHQSFLDPPLAGICCKRDIHFLARKNLLDWPILGPLFPKLNVVPVDQARPDMSALKIVIRLIRAGHCTIIFPEGSRTFDGNLQPAQPGLGLVISKTLAPVVPMRIFGAYEAYPRGAKFPRPHRITIVVGHSMQFTDADVAEAGRDVYLKLSQRVINRIAEIQLE
jgi:1-acyl-sn-glycerol-3-phosphate acyltransferase